jgi:hypothetical protein
MIDLNDFRFQLPMLVHLDGQCRIVGFAYTELEAAIPKPFAPLVRADDDRPDNLRRTERTDDSGHRAYAAIQSLLCATGNISKTLWGHRRDGKLPLATQRKPLRDLLEVTDSSPLYPPLVVRNGFEHYDEKVLDYLEERPTVMLWDSNIGDTDLDSIEHVGRHFNFNSRVVRFMGDKFDIPVIVSEVRRIHALVLRRW